MPQAVALLGAEGAVVQANRQYCDMFGAPGRGQPLPPPLSVPDVKEMLQAVRSGGDAAPRTVETEAALESGAKAWYRVTTAQGGKGSARQVVVIEDITALKDQQARMVANSRLVSVGEMAAGVAHEMNNPLTAIIGFSQLALRQNVDATLRRDLEAIATEAERTGRIVDNLLSFARSYNHGDRVFDAAASIRKILDLREYECRVNNIEVVTYLEPDTPKTQADVHKMEQVILNLLANAIQALADGPGRGTVTVGLVALDGKIRMSFTDDGPGIPPEVMPRLFTPFFTTKPVGKGTGLGLAICQSIVREHGGDIRVESRHKRGTTFVVEMPIVPVPAPEPEKAPEHERRLVSYTMLRVLAVDDEPAVVEMLARALTGMGHQAEVSRDGAEALRMVHLNDYDAILLDIRMPGLGGPEVYRCIQGLRPQMAERVMFITGDPVSPDTRAFIDRTGSKVLQKPFSLDELRRHIEEFAAAKDVRTAAEEKARRPDLSGGLTKLVRSAKS